jgi:hypothetical protein
MPQNYLVLRASPEWLAFDMEETRPFCRKCNAAEDLIIRFAERWRSTFALDYREFRHEMKEIALRSIFACRNCLFLKSPGELPPNLSDDDLVMFMDDDDWIAPGLFESLRSCGEPGDGFLWRSVLLGRFYAGPAENRGEAILQKRRLDDVVYTNNYCVTGSAVRRYGVAALFEHMHAQQCANEGRLSLRKITPCLSCTNKHPCATTFILFNEKMPEVAERLRETVGRISDEVGNVKPDAETLWMAPYLDALAAVLRRNLSPAI